MTATMESRTAAGPDQPTGTGQVSADVFVVFGITGNLARVMTFRSLYRLERRGLLQCPIVGVAVDDWTVDQLVERARVSIEGTGETIDPAIFGRFVGRLSYGQGDLAMRRPTSASPRLSREPTARSSTSRSRLSCSAPLSRARPGPT